MSYAQGFSQLRVASKEQDWNLPFGEIASIWRAGCIIRARFLQKLQMHTDVIQILQTYCLTNILWTSLPNTNKLFVM